jgi:hypothetical protein
MLIKCSIVTLEIEMLLGWHSQYVRVFFFLTLDNGGGLIIVYLLVSNVESY